MNTSTHRSQGRHLISGIRSYRFRGVGAVDPARVLCTNHKLPHLVSPGDCCLKLGIIRVLHADVRRVREAGNVGTRKRLPEQSCRVVRWIQKLGVGPGRGGVLGAGHWRGE